MARTLSATAVKAIQARETAEVFLILLTLSHPTLPVNITVVNDGVDHVVNGSTFQRFPFQVSMPPETEEGQPRVILEICNVDRQIVEAIRTVSGSPITAEMSVVLASSPTTTEAGPYTFTLRDTTYDALTVSGQLLYEDILNEPFPKRTFTPATAPGLF